MGNNFRALYQFCFQSALDVKKFYRKSFTIKYLLSTVIPNKALWLWIHDLEWQWDKTVSNH